MIEDIKFYSNQITKIALQRRKSFQCCHGGVVGKRNEKCSKCMTTLMYDHGPSYQKIKASFLLSFVKLSLFSTVFSLMVVHFAMYLLLSFQLLSYYYCSPC
ncbi:unnamed protein product [Trifolium pratense]|uniref:Uncharacterized protein n=1 Tax=Trifolium pratense TaxID=57577 RepID=A0ACB0JQH7_TRIPR|nr:unnamed protein product [Trifolium pratense]